MRGSKIRGSKVEGISIGRWRSTVMGDTRGVKYSG